MASILKQGSYWYVQWKENGRIRRISSKCKINGGHEAYQTACRVLEKYKKLEIENKFNLKADLPIQEILKSYIQRAKEDLKKEKIKQRSFDTICYILPKLIALCEEKEIKKLGDANELRAGLVVTELRKKYKNNTIRQYLARLGTVWNFGKKLCRGNHENIKNPWGSSFFSPPAEKRRYSWDKCKIKKIIELVRNKNSIICFTLYLQVIYGMRPHQAIETFLEFKKNHFKQLRGPLKKDLKLPLKYHPQGETPTGPFLIWEREQNTRRSRPAERLLNNDLAAAQSYWFKKINLENNGMFVGAFSDSLSHILPYVFANFDQSPTNPQ